MKTAEEFLKESTKKTININEGSPLHDAVIQAMKQYAKEKELKILSKAVDAIYFNDNSDYLPALNSIVELITNEEVDDEKIKVIFKNLNTNNK